MSNQSPLVSVLTPVYNGEKFFAECIESVINQDYKHWEYIIVNNCSTDSSLSIATNYAAIDPRIRVITNRSFVNAEENHNIAFSKISKNSKYCKVVSADDKIFPNCLSKMVSLAEEHPRIGIIGSYQLKNGTVLWKGLPTEIQVISGREICRLCLLTDLGVFGSPTSSMYRSELIRKNVPFFPHNMPHSDTSACFKHLLNSDFGFVHNVLSIERLHNGQLSSKVRKLGMYYTARLDIILEFGPIYLNHQENVLTKKAEFKKYYSLLGHLMLNKHEKEFWDYQKLRMKELGYPIQWNKVILSAIYVFLKNLKTPSSAFKKFVNLIDRKNKNGLELHKLM